MIGKREMNSTILCIDYIRLFSHFSWKLFKTFHSPCVSHNHSGILISPAHFLSYLDEKIICHPCQDISDTEGALNFGNLYFSGKHIFLDHKLFFLIILVDL